jgi:hypothetical protein
MRQPRNRVQIPPHNGQPFYWVRLKNYNTPSQRLDPGGFANAIFRRWSVAGMTWVDTVNPASHHGEFQIFDPENRNFVLPNEIVQVTLNVAAARYEILGSWGLRRKVQITQSGGIDRGFGGTALVWVNGAVTSPAQEITVWVDWMYQDAVSEDDEGLAQYYPDQSKWILENSEC